MKKSEVAEIISNGNARSVNRNDSIVLKPNYLIQIKQTNVFYGVNKEFNKSKLNKICYNLYKKNPIYDKQYFKNKDLSFLVWHFDGEDLVNKEYKYENGYWLDV